MIFETALVYVRAFETITGRNFDPPSADEPVLDRIRRNLAKYF
jgi:phosphoribosylaminoimidazole-succinocarboxamide synthase